jgi:hypothetical protein
VWREKYKNRRVRVHRKQNKDLLEREKRRFFKTDERSDEMKTESTH